MRRKLLGIQLGTKVVLADYGKEQELLKKLEQQAIALKQILR